MATCIAVESIPERITVLRKLSGLSAAELGRRAGLSRATVASLESSRNEEPELKTVTALATATGADLSWLLAGIGRPPSKRRVKAKLAERASTGRSPAGKGKAA